MKELAAKLHDALAGELVADVIRVLIIALADGVAFATDYKFEKENEVQLLDMVKDAYKFCCESNSDIVTTH